MNLWAISDLHIGHTANRLAIAALAPRPDDWLVIAGDAGESPAHLAWVLQTLQPRFRQLVWTPGNHELWTPRSWPAARRGEAHYRSLVDVCRRYGALTPEDPFPAWPGDGPATAIAPTFVLYDYTFRPDDVPAEDAVTWAAETGVRCADEELLAPDPFESRAAWCRARVEWTEERLAGVRPGTRLVLVNHFPTRRDLAVLPRIPRFSIWCGTRATESWTARFPIDVVVFGHLHIRGTRWLDGVRFEEVSLGYPTQWNASRGVQGYLRRILPR